MKPNWEGRANELAGQRAGFILLGICLVVGRRAPSVVFWIVAGIVALALVITVANEVAVHRARRAERREERKHERVSGL